MRYFRPNNLIDFIDLIKSTIRSEENAISEYYGVIRYIKDMKDLEQVEKKEYSGIMEHIKNEEEEHKQKLKDLLVELNDMMVTRWDGYERNNPFKVDNRSD
jgi:bacterioferritin (cytochrome b1)